MTGLWPPPPSRGNGDHGLSGLRVFRGNVGGRMLPCLRWLHGNQRKQIRQRASWEAGTHVFRYHAGITTKRFTVTPFSTLRQALLIEGSNVLFLPKKILCYYVLNMSYTGLTSILKRCDRVPWDCSKHISDLAFAITTALCPGSL